MSKSIWGHSLAAAVLLAPGPVLAQQAAATDVTSVGEIETVVVTAQRREQKLVDVPISITAISAKKLQDSGVKDSTGLTAIAPGLNFVFTGAYAQPTIRGIGTSVTGAGADANVAIYIDGVYQPSQIANAFEFNNIERIEVLKGPQGTLFGRNATGGAITITTLDPSFTPSGTVSVGYGSFQEYKLSAYGNMPLGDQVAVNVAAMYDRDSGYVRNVFLDKNTSRTENFGIRGKLLYQPTQDLSFVLAGVTGYNRNNAPYSTKPIDGNNTAFRTTPALALTVPSDPFEIAEDTDGIDRSSSDGVSLTGKYNTGGGTLTSITSWQRIYAEALVDTDVTIVPKASNHTDLPEHSISQEVNYASAYDGPFNFIAGIYYYHDDSTRHTTNTKGVGGPVSSDFFYNVKTQAEAVYGEIYYNVTDDLQLIGGIRFNNENKVGHAETLFGALQTIDLDKTWSAWTPRASIIYKLDDQSNLYATYSKGFKSGSFNTTTVNNAGPPVDPEFVDAYEIGYKRASDRLTFNLSGYYYNYSDIQVGVQTNIGGVTSGILQNAAAAKIYGIDADITAVLNENFQANAGIAYTHGRYADYPGALLTTPIPGGGNVQTPGDAGGNEMIRAPAVSGYGTISYAESFDFGVMEASLTGSYNSGFYWDPGNRVKQDPFFLLNTTLAWVSPDNKYRVSFWGTNLTNAIYEEYVSVSSTGDSHSLQRPRSFGFTLTRNF